MLKSGHRIAMALGKETTFMPLRKLASGFLNFRDGTFLPKREIFQALAQKQEPKIMMIACSDSRVDPAILTNSEAGDIFMTRNVANLVPPCVRDEAKHGTSAALEFAVTSLEVEHIIVFGHAGCGGIKALLTADPAIAEEHAFIHNWMMIADEARRRTLLMTRNQPLTQQLHTLELEANKTSLANLLTFPWILSRVQADKLRIHGWYFDIDDGEMYLYVPEEDRFRPLTLDIVSDLQDL
jgi:carbonic anhydrase